MPMSRAFLSKSMPLVLAIALLEAAPTPGANAQCANGEWTVVNLHPVGASFSEATGVGGGQQVGVVDDHASLWSGTAASWVDLHPAGAIRSWAEGVNDGQQVGRAYMGGTAYRASMWSGTAASWASLSPATGDFAAAYAVDGGQQVGRVGNHASLWSGTAASWVDLDPGMGNSVAYGVDGGQQVGWAAFGGQHAGLWSGTAASWVDLHPAGAVESVGLAADGGQQVGWAAYDNLHAGLWSGSAASWVDLNPAGAIGSVAEGVHGGQQVGTAYFADPYYYYYAHAGLWSGTAASWVDLHSFLPAEFVASSQARGIWHDAGITYVVGSAYNNATGRNEALMWVHNADPCLPHAWTGVLQPINTDGSSIFKLGSTVPVKFRLTGACESNTTLEARLYGAQISGGVVGTEQEAVSTSSADSGNLFRYSGGQYIFNLGTTGLAAGTWRLRIDLGDCLERTVLISLK
jgi:hypothetical protein